MQFLIGYDISNEKRLQRVYKRMLKFAVPIQYSVFLYDGTLNNLLSALEDVLSEIHQKEDDLRVYPLPSNGKQWRLGKASLPEGIFLTVLPMALND